MLFRLFAVLLVLAALACTTPTPTPALPSSPVPPTPSSPIMATSAPTPAATPEPTTGTSTLSETQWWHLRAGDCYLNPSGIDPFDNPKPDPEALTPPSTIGYDDDAITKVACVGVDWDYRVLSTFDFLKFGVRHHSDGNA